MAYRDARYTVFDAGGVQEMPGGKGRAGGFLSIFAPLSLSAGWMATCFQFVATSQLLSNLSLSSPVFSPPHAGPQWAIWLEYRGSTECKYKYEHGEEYRESNAYDDPYVCT